MKGNMHCGDASFTLPIFSLGPGRRQPPAYSVAAQMARLHRLGRAHSHEGVTQGYHYHTDPDTDQGIQTTFSN